MGLCCILIAIWSLCVWCQEPGQFQTSHEEVARSKAGALDLKMIFARARGLNGVEARSLYVNRVSCARRVYSPAGWLVDGDGDLKLTKITSELYEAEFSSHIHLAEFNPYMNGIRDINTAIAKRLVDLGHWPEGAPLRISKTSQIEFVDEKKATQTYYVQDELRVLDSAPSIFILRETYDLEKKFSFYYLCE